MPLALAVTQWQRLCHTGGCVGAACANLRVIPGPGLGVSVSHALAVPVREEGRAPAVPEPPEAVKSESS